MTEVGRHHVPDRSATRWYLHGVDEPPNAVATSAADVSLLGALRADTGFAARMAALGVTALRVTTVASHGRPEHPLVTDENAPAGSRLAVFMHNDDYTSQDAVVQILESVFALPSERAATLMLEVHTAGAAHIASEPRAIAIEHANRAVAVARDAGFPLLVTVHPPEVD